MRISDWSSDVCSSDLVKSGAPRPAAASAPGTVVIVGGGAAGNAAAEMLRREGHGGAIGMISADDSVPYDRPNLSKDYLAGTASDDWIPLRSEKFSTKRDIELLLNPRVRDRKRVV